MGIGVHRGERGLYVRANRAMTEFVLPPIEANYPDASIQEIDDDLYSTEAETWSSSVQLKPDLFPILRHSQCEDLLNHNYADPVGTLLGSLPSGSLESSVEITLHPSIVFIVNSLRFERLKIKMKHAA